LTVEPADYDDVGSLRRAFAGASALVLISSDGDAEDMFRHHRNMIAAMTGSPIEHVTYLSIIDDDPSSTFFYAPGHHRTEALLAETGVPCCVARTSVFADFFHATWIAPYLQDRSEVEVSFRDGTISLVTRDDVGRSVAVAASLRSTETLSLTGPASLSLEGIAQAAAEHHGTRFRFRSVDDQTYRERRSGEGVEPWLVEAFASMFATIEGGGFASVTHDVHRLTGRPAESWTRFLDRTP